jgi:dual specificity phosphatase 3
MKVRMTASTSGAPMLEESPGANISYITGRVWTGGDLPSDLGDEAMVADLAEIQKAGITDIIDNRIEWSDEEFVRAHAPDMGFLWNGADDVGQVMSDEWFDAGVVFALNALEDRDAQVLAHCHMGINRGPSMAFAILLATGMDPVGALAAIREARPIAAIAYDGDALDWWHRRSDTPAGVVKRQLAEVAAWHGDNPLDVVRIIRTLRDHEEHDRPLSL